MVTRRQIRQRARVRADQTDSTFPTDDEYNLLIDQAAAETWYDLIGAGWPTDQEDVSITADGSARYPLTTAGTRATVDPTDCWQPSTGPCPDPGQLPIVGFRQPGAYGNTWTFNMADDAALNAETFTIDYDAETIVFHYDVGVTTAGDMEDLLNAHDLLIATVAPASGSFVIPEENPSGDMTVNTHVATALSGGADPGDEVFAVTGAWRIEGGIKCPLKRVNEGYRSSLESTQDTLAEAYEARVSSTEGTVALFYPVPAGGSYLVRVIRVHLGFSSEFDVWRGPPRSDELVVLKAAAAGMRKEGDAQGADQLDRERGVLFDRVLNMANWLHMRDPVMIRDEGPSGALGRPDRLPFDYDV